MKNTITFALLVIIAASSRAGAQGFQTLPQHNIQIPDFNPPGSAQNPIYVQPANTPSVIYPPPQINTQPREREYIPVYPRPERPASQERLAPRAEFEMIRFIPTEPYVYSLVKADMTATATTSSHDMNAKIPRGKSRIVIGKTKTLNTDLDSPAEVLALATKYHADEIILHNGRQWNDAGELLIKFVVWK